jgi:hypothetical protein
MDQQRILLARAEKDAPNPELRALIHHNREMDGFLWKSSNGIPHPDGTFTYTRYPYPENEPLHIRPHKPLTRVADSPVP